MVLFSIIIVYPLTALKAEAHNNILKNKASNTENKQSRTNQESSIADIIKVI